MSLSVASQVSIGSNVTLTCQVNIPLSDVTLHWQKTGKKMRKRLRGHTHAQKGSSELILKNLSKDDFGTYLCVVVYDIGTQTLTQIDSMALNGKHGKMGREVNTNKTHV